MRAARHAFVFHAGNAYDAADGTVVMDVVRYESMFYTNSLSAFEDEARLYRWTAIRQRAGCPSSSWTTTRRNSPATTTA